MKCKVHLKEFQKTIENISKATSKALPILTNVKLQAIGNHIILTATNLDIYIKATLDAQIIKEGEILLDKTAINIIKSLKGNEIEITENTIGDLGYKSECSTIDFPECPILDNNKYFEITEKELQEALKVRHMAGDKKDQYVNYIMIDQNYMLATDGYRLSVYKMNVNSNMTQVLVCVDSCIDILEKLLTRTNNVVEVYMNSDCVIFKFRNFEVYCKINKDGRLIDYKYFINLAHATKFEVNTKEMLEKLNIVYKVLDRQDKNNRIVLTIKDSEIVIKPYNSDFTIKTSIENFVGNEMEICCNCEFLIGSLKLISSKKCNFAISNYKPYPLLVMRDENGILTNFVLPIAN